MNSQEFVKFSLQITITPADCITGMKVRPETAWLLLYQVAWLKQTGKPAIPEAALAKFHYSTHDHRSLIGALAGEAASVEK